MNQGISDDVALLLEHLAAQDCEKLKQQCGADFDCSRFFDVIFSYPAKFITPPKHHHSSFNCVEFLDKSGCDIRAPLYSLEEGVSDLVACIQCKYNYQDNAYKIYDLLVP